MGRYLEKARELRAITERHYNCAQAVLVPFAPRLGLDEETAFRIGANFGGGMRVASVCGAITGGLMVLGLAGFDQPSDAVSFIQKMKDRHDGMMMCADLLRVNEAKGGVKKVHCDGVVFEAVSILEEILNEEN